MKITFIGALHEVTGSCTLLEVNGKNYLVDCGMELGRDVFENVPIPVSMGEIEGVFLTHAHIDHSGMLPKLYKDGYRGPIYATGGLKVDYKIFHLDLRKILDDLDYGKPAFFHQHHHSLK